MLGLRASGIRQIDFWWGTTQGSHRKIDGVCNLGEAFEVASNHGGVFLTERAQPFLDLGAEELCWPYMIHASSMTTSVSFPSMTLI